VDPMAEWELEGDMEFVGSGKVGLDGLVVSRPVQRVTFALVRSDQTINRFLSFL